MMSAVIKTYGKKELAEAYRVDVKTFIAWLRRHKETRQFADDSRRLFTPAEVKLIFHHIGEP